MIDARRLIAPALAGLVAVAGLAVNGPAAAAGAPRGIHVASGADPASSATVVWFTDGFDDPGTTLQYGANASTLDVTAFGSSTQAPGEGYPAGSVLVHEVALTGLPPDGVVFYRVGSDAAWSDVFSFRTASGDGDAIRFVAYGDQDVTENSQIVTDAVLAEDPDMVLVAGDLSYAQPGTPTFPEWPKWDAWFDMIQPLAATRAFMPAVGNHECESIGCTSSFRTRFALPGEELFYSFDRANVHVLVFLSDRNTWNQERRIADALAFAEQDLADAAERKQAGEIDWIIVVQHHPLYGSQRADLPSDAALERWYNPALIALEERMLHTYNVDVLIAGHNHNYQRTKPIVFGAPTTNELSTYTDPDGFIQVITGGAGRGLAGIDPGRPLDDFEAASARRHHFTIFDIDGKTMAFQAIATDVPGGEIIDSFTLTRT